jgi:hypothetical protein
MPSLWKGFLKVLADTRRDARRSRQAGMRRASEADRPFRILNEIDAAPLHRDDFPKRSKPPG